MKISIPKDFFEKKASVSLSELVTMVSEFARKAEELEENHNYERENHYELRLENKVLRQRIKELEGVQS